MHVNVWSLIWFANYIHVYAKTISDWSVNTSLSIRWTHLQISDRHIYKDSFTWIWMKRIASNKYKYNWEKKIYVMEEKLLPTHIMYILSFKYCCYILQSIVIQNMSIHKSHHGHSTDIKSSLIIYNIWDQTAVKHFPAMIKKPPWAFNRYQIKPHNIQHPRSNSCQAFSSHDQALKGHESQAFSWHSPAFPRHELKGWNLYTLTVMWWLLWTIQAVEIMSCQWEPFIVSSNKMEATIITVKW